MISLLDKWRHTGFNIFSRPCILPRYEKSLENLARYIIRASFSRERMATSDIFSFDPAKAWEFSCGIPDYQIPRNSEFISRKSEIGFSY